MSFYSFKNRLKDFFSFNRSHKKFVLLLFLFLIVLAAIQYYFRFRMPVEPVDFSEFEKDIERFENQLKQDSALAAQEKLKKKNYYSELPEDSAMAAELFPFNPNELADSLWQKLGISNYMVRRIKNYESKGGRFRKKEDLKKIYGFNESDYKRLEPYIQIPGPDTKATFITDTLRPKWERKKAEPVIFDLNTVNAEDLKTIYGIGTVISESIINYRTSLGGFVHPDQLTEAFGVDSALFGQIKEKFEIRSKHWRRMNINTDNPDELKHPYITKQMAALIINYRKMHGDYKSTNELKNISSLNERHIARMLPYIMVK